MVLPVRRDVLTHAMRRAWQAVLMCAILVQVTMVVLLVAVYLAAKVRAEADVPVIVVVRVLEPHRSNI